MSSVRYRFHRNIRGGLELEAARLAGPEVADASIAHAFRPRGGNNVGGAIRTEMKRLCARAVNAWCPVQTIHGDVLHRVPDTHWADAIRGLSAVKSAMLTYTHKAVENALPAFRRLAPSRSAAGSIPSAGPRADVTVCALDLDQRQPARIFSALILSKIFAGDDHEKSGPDRSDPHRSGNAQRCSGFVSLSSR